MDFSITAKACFDWVMVVMKPTDSLVILNVLNLKTPSRQGGWISSGSLCSRHCCE